MTYLNYTKSIITSILFIFPFFLLYEFIAFFKFLNKPYQIRNTADILIRDFFSIFTEHSMFLYSFFLIIIFFSLLIFNITEIKKYSFKINYISFMYIEALIWGVLLIIFLNGFDVFEEILQSSIINDYLMSFYFCVGAGIWEEILFRFVCINFFLIILKFFNVPLNTSIIISFFISSILFSLFHYIGSMADNFSLYSFIYRFLGGIYLSILYYYRGIGISMMSHFVYDFLLITLPII